MGMTLELVTVSDATIERLHADPPLVWALVAPDDPGAVVAARTPPRPGLFARLFGRGPEPAPASGPATLALGPGEGERVDLDKAWHGIHWLLTGTAWEGEPPLDLLVSGGREIDDTDMDFGPPRTATAAETRAFAEALEAISDAELRARFRPAEMTRLEIYPEIWDRDPAEDDTLGYLMENVAQLREFVATAARRELGLLITLM